MCVLSQPLLCMVKQFLEASYTNLVHKRLLPSNCGCICKCRLVPAFGGDCLHPRQNEAFKSLGLCPALHCRVSVATQEGSFFQLEMLRFQIDRIDTTPKQDLDSVTRLVGLFCLCHLGLLTNRLWNFPWPCGSGPHHDPCPQNHRLQATKHIFRIIDVVLFQAKPQRHLGAAKATCIQAREAGPTNTKRRSTCQET